MLFTSFKWLCVTKAINFNFQDMDGISSEKNMYELSL